MRAAVKKWFYKFFNEPLPKSSTRLSRKLRKKKLERQQTNENTQTFRRSFSSADVEMTSLAPHERVLARLQEDDRQENRESAEDSLDGASQESHENEQPSQVADGKEDVGLQNLLRFLQELQPLDQETVSEATEGQERLEGNTDDEGISGELQRVPAETEEESTIESRDENTSLSLRFCVICDDDQAADQFPRVPDACTGSHESDACAYDWDEYLEHQISFQRPDRIACIQCPNVLTQTDIRRLCMWQTFEKYLEAELKAALSADETFTWCIAAECNSGQQHFDGDIFTCLRCGHKHCTSCHLDWHPEETCQGSKDRKLREEREALEAKQAAEEERKRLAEEHAARSQRLEREETASTLILDRETKICPGPDCNKRIVKVSGCDHMVCTACRHEFCWACLADYDEVRQYGNHRHGKTCPHWRAFALPE